MNTYTDFYVMPVKTARLEDYRRFAEESRKVWLAHGALSVTEYIADDAKPGVHTSFPQSVKLEAGLSVNNITNRSIPIPKPPAGGIPFRKALTKS